MSSFNLKEIIHSSKEYDAMVALRFEILRKPLGLTFTKEQLASEKNYIHLGLFLQQELLACCILLPAKNNSFQLKQMAVSNRQQSKGLGAQLLAFAEEIAIKNNTSNIILHARQTALGFYQKAGYNILGDMFMEVGIPHFEMEKKLI